MLIIFPHISEILCCVLWLNIFYEKYFKHISCVHQENASRFCLKPISFQSLKHKEGNNPFLIIKCFHLYNCETTNNLCMKSVDSTVSVHFCQQNVISQSGHVITGILEWCFSLLHSEVSEIKTNDETKPKHSGEFFIFYWLQVVIELWLVTDTLCLIIIWCQCAETMWNFSLPPSDASGRKNTDVIKVEQEEKELFGQ